VLHHKSANPRTRGAGVRAITKRSGLFDVSFDKPQVLIQIAGSGGKDICGIFIFRFGDGFTQVVRDNRVTIGQLFQVIT